MFIRSNYGSPDKYSEECTALYRARQDMRSASKDESGRDLLYRYYGQLELLELRFPIDEDHIRISFNWYDAFTEAPISQHSLAYEKACVLFNIAATLSYTASTQTRTEVDGMKRAYHSLQACAGLLTFINDNFLHAPSTDLSRELVKALSSLMLAQAQEVFTEKQIRDSGKPSIIGKLAAEAASLYHNANEGFTELVIAGNIDVIWATYAQVKERYFSSIAHYFQALFEISKEKHGIAVARLQAGVTLAKEALTLAKTNSGSFSRYPWLSTDPGTAFVEATKANLDLINDQLTTAKKENDMIYHEAVAKENALPAVGKLSSAKPISLTDLYAGQDVARIIGPDIFRKLVPISIHESSSLYSEEIAKLLRSEQERSDIADSELITALEYLGLPKSLQQFKTSDERNAQDLARPPDHIREIAKTARSLEHGGTVKSQLDSVQRLRLKIADNIARLTRQLEEESQQCNAMRNRYRSEWQQAPSAQSNSSMLSDLNNFRKSLESATKSDAQMQTEYNSLQAEIDDLINEDPDHLDVVFQGLIIQNNTSSAKQASLLDLDDAPEPANDTAIKVDQVDDALRKLNLVKKERQQTLHDLKEKARNDDISEVLMFNKKTPDLEQRVFASELEKFKPHQLRISATISRQEQLIEDMTRTFTSVLKDKEGQAKQQKWETISRLRATKVANLERAANVHSSISSGLSRATKFYTDLDKLTEDLSSRVKQYLQARQNEGRQLLNRIGGARPLSDADAVRRQMNHLNMKDRPYGSQY